MIQEKMTKNELYLEWHDEMAVAILAFIFRESCDDDGRECGLILHTDIVFSYHRERLEEVLSIHSYDIFLSFYGSRDRYT